jgi:hypothetical protein
MGAEIAQVPDARQNFVLDGYALMIAWRLLPGLHAHARTSVEVGEGEPG